MILSLEIGIGGLANPTPAGILPKLNALGF